MNKKQKSVITCDLEGRIETYNQGAEEIFGYKAEEVIGKKRVSLFSPGKTVLEFVPNWLKVASEQGEYRTKTVFLDRDHNPVAAEIRGSCTEYQPHDTHLLMVCYHTSPVPHRHNYSDPIGCFLGGLQGLGAALSVGFVFACPFCRHFPACGCKHV
jgi:PAS domain S-box-containing protein